MFFASRSFEQGRCSYLRWSPSNGGGSSWGRQGRNLLCASQTTVDCSSTMSLFGKTLRNGTKHVFGVLRSEDAVLCPVAAVDEYVQGAARLGVELGGHGRYLFPPCRDGRVSAGPLKSAQLNEDLKYWLTRCHIFGGETMHGMRSGGSIEKSLSGESLHSWRTGSHPRWLSIT